MAGRRIAVIALLLATVIASSPPASSAVSDIVDAMTLKEKVGQLVMFSVRGTSLTSAEKDAIRRHDLGGVILFSRNYSSRAQLQRLTGQIQWNARTATTHKLGALISVDQEGGVVKRFPDMPPWYSAPQMGTAGDPTLAYNQGQKTGYALRHSGVNVNLAPVADLDLGPNHVMRSRSFGSRPRRVGRLVKAFSRGLQSRRVAATAKHFPGFGGASINSDYGPAYIRRSKWQLHNVDDIPFNRAIDGNLRMMMVSHGIYVNDGGSRPASLNWYIATQRLRNEFGFKGVAISDALNAVAWYHEGSVRAACRATIRAGVDIALIVGDHAQAARCATSIIRAVKTGKIPRARIDRAVTRVLSLKAWLGVL
jgi:beta-N-acetylhexosaminidase